MVVPEYKMTAVGATLNLHSTCNGVIVPIQETELPKFDKRESGYHRSKVDRSNIKGINNQTIPKGSIWVYIPDEIQSPSLNNPIAQSYVDVIISACFDYGEDFARQFIKTTLNWDSPWINDRQNPRYPRAMSKVPLASKIDSLLEQLIPTEFLQRN